MPDTAPTRQEMEAFARDLFREHGVPQPDQVLPHEDGGIVLLWEERKLAVVIDP